MRVAVVENTQNTALGQLGIALGEAGAVVEIFRPYCGGALPDGPEAFDALAVLGGEQSALDDVRHPYLGALSLLMRDYTAAGRAVLGICLGAQLLARGHGGQNLLGAAPEFGWRHVRLRPEADVDPVLSAVGAPFPIFQWHRDTFTLPAGALHLAEAPEVAHQAFRLGRAAYGMQFHFEANREVVADWTRDFPAATEAMWPGWIADHPALAARYGMEADAAGLAIARAWVARI